MAHTFAPPALSAWISVSRFRRRCSPACQIVVIYPSELICAAGISSLRANRDTKLRFVEWGLNFLSLRGILGGKKKVIFFGSPIFTPVPSPGCCKQKIIILFKLHLMERSCLYSVFALRLWSFAALNHWQIEFLKKQNKKKQRNSTANVHKKLITGGQQP